MAFGCVVGCLQPLDLAARGIDAEDRGIERFLRGDIEALAVRRPGDRADGAIPRFGEFARLAIFEVARSEEHTSELQSLMRISYAVFCLKKTKDQKKKQTKT